MNTFTSHCINAKGISLFGFYSLKYFLTIHSRNWKVWRKILPQLGLQGTRGNGREESGGDWHWQLGGRHRCGGQQSCWAGWGDSPGFFNHCNILRLVFTVKRSKRWLICFPWMFSAGIPEHSQWCLGHPSGFWQRLTGWQVQHALCPCHVQAVAHVFS